MLAYQWKEFYESTIAQLNPALVDYFRAAALYDIATTDERKEQLAQKKNEIYKKHNLQRYQVVIDRLLPSYTVVMGDMFGKEAETQPRKSSAGEQTQQVR